MLGTNGDTRARARCNFTIKGLACAALLACAAPIWALPTLSSEQPEAGPAMWAISDEDTTIFLFGTFHALDSDTGWFSNIVRAAFDRSDELVLETVVPDSPEQLLASLSRHSLASEPQVGQSVVPQGSGGSFAASSRQAMSAGRGVGMNVDDGADAVLRRAADSAGKPVDGLESFEFQLAMFTSLPSPHSAGGKDAASPEKYALVMQDMKAAWKRGDPARFAAVLGTMEQQSPETYRRLFADRNTRWAEWVARRMNRPGVVFVAVGTGHLIGRDSVQQRLTERGFKAFRVS